MSDSTQPTGQPIDAANSNPPPSGQSVVSADQPMPASIDAAVSTPPAQEPSAAVTQPAAQDLSPVPTSPVSPVAIAAGVVDPAIAGAIDSSPVPAAGEFAPPIPPADSEEPTASGELPDAAPSIGTATQPPASVIVRFGLMQQLGEFSHDLSHPPVPGNKVVIRTDRGVEMGEVVVSVSREPSWRCITSSRLAEYIRACGPEFSVTRSGKILRLANEQDMIDHRHLRNSAREEAIYARQQIRELSIQMRLVTVEHMLGGERIIFYFSAENRIDFRELVRRLAAQFRTRIEMRQVGTRDEARLVGDYERCGQRCCCQSFLKDLKPVSMRMAKVQKATLDPSKISGRCSRLMCCLRYEDAGYDELHKKLPRKNTWVRTEKFVGRVFETQTLTQLVRLALPDGTAVVVANEEILERDVPPVLAPPPRLAPAPPVERPEPRMLRDQTQQDAPAQDQAARPEQARPQQGRQEQGRPERGRRDRSRRRDRGPDSSRPPQSVQNRAAEIVNSQAPAAPPTGGPATQDPESQAIESNAQEQNQADVLDDAAETDAAPAQQQGRDRQGRPQGQGQSPDQAQGQGGEGAQRRKRRRRHRSRRRGNQGPGGNAGGPGGDAPSSPPPPPPQ